MFADESVRDTLCPIQPFFGALSNDKQIQSDVVWIFPLCGVFAPTFAQFFAAKVPRALQAYPTSSSKPQRFSTLLLAQNFY
eukprot:scaffold848_cov247-Pinguiococcus_pyrenoidosus.AAC.27